MRHDDALAALKAATATTDLSAPARAVYLLLIVRSNEVGWCWPGVESIAADTGLHPGTVRKARAQLVAAGLMMVDLTDGGWPPGDVTNLYRLPVAVVHTPRPQRGVSGGHPAPTARTPRAHSADTPRRRRGERVIERVTERGARHVDPHDDHRPGDCAECDKGIATLAERFQIDPLADARRRARQP